MEIWDGYNRDGTLAGVDLVRGERLSQGLYHLVCEVLVRHTDGDYLLMQRAKTKPNYGGFWEATAGGSALKGEDAFACVKSDRKKRELPQMILQSLHGLYLTTVNAFSTPFYA